MKNRMGSSIAYVIGIWQDGEFLGYVPDRLPHAIAVSNIAQAKFYKTKGFAQRRVSQMGHVKNYNYLIFKVSVIRVSCFDKDGKERMFI